MQKSEEISSRNTLSIYLRNDELDFVQKKSAKVGKSVSAYIRALVNADRFGVDQKEINFDDLAKNNLPEMFRKLAEMNRRIDDLEKRID